MSLQVHPNARKKKAAPKPGSEEEIELQREQADMAVRQGYQQGAQSGTQMPGCLQAAAAGCTA